MGHSHSHHLPHGEESDARYKEIRRITLIGSANMDRRSFDLNYENNILLVDEALTRAVRERQEQYLVSSNGVSREDIEAWSILRRFWNNLLGMLGPVL